MAADKLTAPLAKVDFRDTRLKRVWTSNGCGQLRSKRERLRGILKRPMAKPHNYNGFFAGERRSAGGCETLGLRC